jgi:phage shock protein A
MIIQRIVRIWRAWVGSGLSQLETEHAGELLGLEREQLCSRIAQYNRGLAGYAAMSERLKGQQKKLAHERRTHEARLAARLTAGDRTAAGRHALRIEVIDRESLQHAQRLTETEATYRELVRARDAALAAAGDKIESLKRSIGDYQVQKALAELTEVAAGMHGSLGLSDGTLERLKERVDDKRNLAAGRARVARDGIDTTSIEVQEAERDGIAQQALDRFEQRLPANATPSTSIALARTGAQ